MSLMKVTARFFTFEAVSVRTVAVTAAMSYILQINAIIAGEPLYLIALYTLLPWLPIAFYEGIWKVKNYAAVAFLGIFTVMQVGHFAEHAIQVLQIDLANRGVALGVRDALLEPSFYSVEAIIKPGADGMPITGSDGQLLSGAAACAVFGQLDLEIVHLVWELIGLFGTAACLYFFPRNVFLWLAFAGLSWHALEHLTITYFYYYDQEPLWEGFRQLWATYPTVGNSYVAHPVGKEEAMLNFYHAGGKFGLMAKHGMFQQLTGFEGMPGRAHLHMGYNMAITIPTVLGFLMEIKVIRNKYIEQAFGKLSSSELVDLSLRVTNRRFAKGDTVFSQGDVANNCFVISQGSAEIYLNKGKPSEALVATLTAGQIFGEMGLLDETAKKRTATVVALTKLECLEIDAATFADLAAGGGSGDFQSDSTSENIKNLVEVRLAENRNA
jgi:hypothetical protein